MARSTKYPYLQRYLASVVRSSDIQDLKRPRAWILGVTALSAVIAFDCGWVMVALIIALGMIANITIVRSGAKLSSNSTQALGAAGLRELQRRQAIKIIRRLAQRGGLEAAIGVEACETLESCAEICLRWAAYILSRAGELPGSDERQREETKRTTRALEAEFRKALEVVSDAVWYKLPVDNEGHQIMSRAWNTLRELSEKAKGASAISSARPVLPETDLTRDSR